MQAAPSIYPRLQNVRCFVPGRLDSRAGMAKINALALADLDVHSLKRLNNPCAAVTGGIPGDTGAVICGVGVNDPFSGTIFWTNPGNVTASDNVRAAVIVAVANTSSEWLKATGFPFPALPAGAIPTGFAVYAEGYRSSFGPYFIRVRLVKAGVIQTFQDYLPQLPVGVGSEAVVSVGGVGSLWGGTWTAADIDPGFGFAIQVYKWMAGVNVTECIDALSMIVYYEIPPTPWTRVVGAGPDLYSGQTAFTLRDSGYSGDPLSFVSWRPENTPESWLYIADRQRMRKIRTDGTNYAVGIELPPIAPDIAFAAPLVSVTESFNAVGTWANGGTAGALGAANHRINTTISALLYDNTVANTGWVSIQPAAMGVEIRPGALVYIDLGGANEELVRVQSVQRAASATTIGSIVYDVGTVGLCTIQPVCLPGLMPNTLVNLGGTEIVRVLSITRNVDGTVSIRTSTTINHIAAEAFTVLPTFRAYCTITHIAAETLIIHYVNSAITVGVGTITNTAAYDLSRAGGRPVRDEDEIHLSILMDNTTRLVEGRISFDVDLTTHDFQHNAYYKAFRASDLTLAAVGAVTTLSAMQTAIQNAQIEAAQAYQANLASMQQAAGMLGAMGVTPEFPPPPSSYTGPTPTGEIVTATQVSPGTSQWYELSLKIKGLQRIGADTNRNLSNVAAIQISFNVSDAVNVGLSSLTIQGTYGPDSGSIGGEYYYRYRARSAGTGAKSGWSPATRYSLRPHRQRILVTMPQHSDSQADRLDVARFGGALTKWMYVGTCPNSASPSFTDDLMDADLLETADLDIFQPFPTLDIPRQGTCNVVGTTITWVSGDYFNTAWAPGSVIRIDGLDCVLYAPPATSTTLEVVTGMGTLAGVSFELTGATILGQPLSSIWGPFQGAILGCGDPHQPGVLFWTRGNDPDACSEAGYLEVTSPSEPLIGGFMYNGLSYVFSSERLFAAYPAGATAYISAGAMAYVPTAGTVTAGLSFTTLEVIGSKGLFDRNCLAIGPVVYFLSKDGIYQTSGGPPTSITALDLSLLFPHDGQPGQAVTLGSATFYPPAMTCQRLHYYDGHLYFDYVDTQAHWRTLVYNELTTVWSQDAYNTEIECHYGEEGDGIHSMLLGGTDGFVRLATGTSDDGVDFVTDMRMPLVSDLNGYLHLRDGYLGLMADANLDFIVNVDGVDHSHAIAAVAGGPYQKTYQPLMALKGLAYEFALTSTGPFRLFQRDSFVRLKPWGDEGGYQDFYPFAELRRGLQKGAQ